MNPREPADDEINRLLGRQLRDTTPEFEARWVELKRALRHSPPRRRWLLPPLWSLLFAGGVAVAALLLVIRLAVAPAPEPSPRLADLWVMDEALAHSTILLDEASRDELLHVSVVSTNPVSAP